MEEKNKFPGGLFERVWIVSFITGVFLKILGYIGWLGFFIIITIWPVIVVVAIIAAIVAFVKLNGMMKREEGEDDDQGS